MKNRLTITLTLFYFMPFFFSCGQSNKGKVVVLADSLIGATENIAIGKAKFGISEKQFYELYPDSLIVLDGSKYIVSAFFNSSKELNMVYLIDSTIFQNTKFDQALLNRMDLIKAYFIKTYGSPQQNRGYPNKIKMLNGKAFESYKWTVGKKKIAVGIALEETERGSIYYVVCHVERNNE